MRSLVAMLLAVCLLLSGCVEAAPPATTAAPTQAPTQAPTEPPTEPMSSVYDGTLDRYAYRYTNIRHRHWEEDILYAAQVLLGQVFANGHPYLTDMEYQTFFAVDDNSVEYKTYYDPQLRQEFIRGINDLLDRIPELEDHEILYGLQRLVARLGDLHTYVVTPAQRVYPYLCLPFYEEEGVAWYVTVLPRAHEALLYSRVVEINGMPMEAVAESLRAYVSHENEYAANAMAANLLSSCEALSVIGAVEWLQKEITLCLEDGQGQRHTLTLALDSQEDRVGNMPWTLDSPLNRHAEGCYSWEYMEKEKLLYARFNHIEEDPDLVYSSFVRQLARHVEDTPKTKKIVIDLRQNPGGYFHASLAVYLSSFLNKQEGRDCYVLLDAQSYSAAIILGSSLRQMSPQVKLVGTPGGQPANFFASVHSYELPWSGEWFAMSDTFWISDASDTGDALMPDVVLYQTLEDFAQGRDTVIHRIIQGKVK